MKSLATKGLHYFRKPPASFHLFEENNENTRKNCPLCNCFFIINYEQMLPMDLVFPMLTWNK